MSANRLTPEQVERLVKAISEPIYAFHALKYTDEKFTAEQQEHLVKITCKSSLAAQLALAEVSWLKDEQKAQLRAVA